MSLTFFIFRLHYKPLHCGVYLTLSNQNIKEILDIQIKESKEWNKWESFQNWDPQKDNERFGIELKGLYETEYDVRIIASMKEESKFCIFEKLDLPVRGK